MGVMELGRNSEEGHRDVGITFGHYFSTRTATTVRPAMGPVGSEQAPIYLTICILIRANN